MYEINGVDMRDILLLLLSIFFVWYAIYMRYFLSKVKSLYQIRYIEFWNILREREIVVSQYKTKLNEELLKNSELREKIKTLEKKVEIFDSEIRKLGKMVANKSKLLDSMYHKIKRVRDKVKKIPSQYV